MSSAMGDMPDGLQNKKESVYCPDLEQKHQLDFGSASSAPEIQTNCNSPKHNQIHFVLFI